MNEHRRLKDNHLTKKRICSICKLEKDWIIYGRSGMTKKYKSKDGLSWNGSWCGPCNTIRNKKKRRAVQR